MLLDVTKLLNFGVRTLGAYFIGSLIGRRLHEWNLKDISPLDY